MQHRNPLTWLTDRALGNIGRWVVIGLWLVAAGLLSGVAPKLANYYNDKATSSIGTPESVQASAIVAKAFPHQQGLPAIIVVSNPSGLTTADQHVATQIACWLLTDAQRAANAACAGLTYPDPRPADAGPVVSLVNIPQAKNQLVSTDGTTQTIIVALNLPQSDSLAIQKDIKAIRAYTDSLAGPSLAVKVTGPSGILADLVNIFAGADVKLLLTTVLLVLVLLAVIYRSPLLALLPIIGVGWVLAIVNGILGFAAKAQLFPIGQQPTSIMDVLLFGAGTDYTIFIVARLREELRHQPDRHVALQTTMRSVGEAITSSAGTVILGLLTLVLTVLGLYSSLGLVLAIAVAVMLLAGLTLVPAILSVLGNAAFWPFIPRVQTATERAAEAAKPESGFWGAIARFVVRNPVAAIIGSLVLLGALALGNLGIRPDFNSLSDLRNPTPSTDGYKILAKHFAPGTLAPFNVVIHWR
ncbi:MAG: MMPL family transporter, partial [Ktedonobacterales bacterium]|nr:MMPL family transporter [Ktedonobacterales bacterium]